ncbi:MAG: ketose-bisphosphate aldolase [Candidatus Onthovivens sp.]|nr:ketose-bisphosphate aldolase [Candidatus Onthovivens sp.]
MALVTTKKMFEKAYKGQYSIGAFNVDTFETFQAVIEAAKLEKSPVIIQITENVIKYIGPKYLMMMAKIAGEEEGVEIALHLDHGKTVDVCKYCVDLGFTSVMIDASAYDFETNIKMTKEVVDYAHAKGVVVESELGAITGIEDDSTVEDKYGHFTHPDDVVEFVNRTGIDSLAIAIGTAHGAFKYKPGEKPALRFDILEEIEERLPGFPLVLHGSSSVPQDKLALVNKYGGKMKEAIGIPEPMLREASRHAVCKINVGTDLRVCWTGKIREYFALHPEEFEIRKYQGPAREDVREMVRDKMRNVFGSSNHLDK